MSEEARSQTTVPSLFSWSGKADTPTRKRLSPVDRHSDSPMSKKLKEQKSDSARLEVEKKRKASNLEEELVSAKAELEVVEVELTWKRFCPARFENSDSDPSATWS